MHFREVNKKLNQLKTDVYWADQSLLGLESNSPFYNARFREYTNALADLKAFRNTTLAQLDVRGVNHVI